MYAFITLDGLYKYVLHRKVISNNQGVRRGKFLHASSSRGKEAADNVYPVLFPALLQAPSLRYVISP
jgi:hypothetical protein